MTYVQNLAEGERNLRHDRIELITKSLILRDLLAIQIILVYQNRDEMRLSS